MCIYLWTKGQATHTEADVCYNFAWRVRMSFFNDYFKNICIYKRFDPVTINTQCLNLLHFYYIQVRRINPDAVFSYHVDVLSL